MNYLIVVELHHPHNSRGGTFSDSRTGTHTHLDSRTRVSIYKIRTLTVHLLTSAQLVPVFGWKWWVYTLVTEKSSTTVSALTNKQIHCTSIQKPWYKWSDWRCAQSVWTPDNRWTLQTQKSDADLLFSFLSFSLSFFFTFAPFLSVSSLISRPH